MVTDLSMVSTQTGMRLNKTDSWTASGHQVVNTSVCDHDVERVSIAVRKIGWIDQTGRVWLTSQAWQRAGGPGGSITPLLIQDDCD